MKKTISFVLVTFLILLGTAQSNVASAQGKAHEQYTMSHYGWWEILVPIYNDNEIVEVEMTLYFHCVCHWIYTPELGFKEQDMIMRWRGDFEYDGELFNVDFFTLQSVLDDNVRSDPEYWQNVPFVSHVKGSNGTNLIITGTVDMNTWWDFDASDWVITIDEIKGIPKEK